MGYYAVIERDASETVLMRWVNLAPAMQNEASQKEEEKYHTLSHI